MHKCDSFQKLSECSLDLTAQLVIKGLQGFQRNFIRLWEPVIKHYWETSGGYPV